MAAKGTWVRAGFTLLALLLLGCPGGGGGSDGSSRRSLIPLADFFGNQPGSMSMTQISPNGTYTAWLGPGEGPPPRRRNLFVSKSVGGGAPRQVTRVTDRDITRFTWFSDHRLGYLLDPDGDENERLYAVDADGSRPMELTPGALRQVDTEVLCKAPAGLWSGGGPWGSNRWLVAIGPAHSPKDCYWVDVDTGAYGLKEKNPGNIVRAIPDPEGRILLAYATQDGVEWSVVYRSAEDQPYRVLATVRHPDVMLPVSILAGGRNAKVITNVGRDKAAERMLDLASGELGPVLKEDVDSDLEDQIGFRKGLGGPWGRPGWPGLACSGSALECRGRAVTYAARDGLPIPAYLYLPAGRAPAGAPAVIYCHGGPECRDERGLDTVPLFLASRGLVVLAPNFRGSKGYGKAFRAAGHGQWGRAMQDDLTDGARWLVRQGYADPLRIGIAGFSYGGYAALAGAALTPGEFRCVVAGMGPSDLLTFLDSPYCQSRLDYWRLLAGDPRTMAAELKAVSPLHQAGRIRIPVLLAHGDRDSRVLKAESDRMAAALRAQGAFVPYLAMRGEGHGRWREESEMELFRAVENFFGLHLGSQVEAPTPHRLTP